MSYSHIIDSRFHGGGYSTETSRKIFADTARLSRWLWIEYQLATAQSELGIIPLEAAQEIGRHLSIENYELAEISEEIERTNHSLVPLLRQLQKKCSGNLGQYVHYGATTQDIQDTGQMIALKEVIAQARVDLMHIKGKLSTLAKEHKHSLQTGRTHAQPALPITFGLKVASWYDELHRCEERILEGESRILVGQLFGACGTLSVFEEKGLTLLESFCMRCGLGVPSIGWHVARDRLSEFLVSMAILTATLARIADEIRTLSRHEFRELSLSWQPGTVGSSTMPHKRNPEECEQVVVLARLTKALASAMLEAQIIDHERDYRGTRIEWVAITDASHYSLKALDLTKQILDQLVVNKDVMMANALKYREEICTEAIVFELGKHIGKQDAYQLVYDLSQRSQSDGDSLAELLKRDEISSQHLTNEKVDQLLNPAHQTGSSVTLIERSLGQK